MYTGNRWHCSLQYFPECFTTLCGNFWLSVLTAGKGQVANNPGRHCRDILNSGQSRGNGLYWIDPNGGLTEDSFQAFCDMDTEGGGWTLVATKVSPSFLFIRTGFSTWAAKTTNADAGSHIHRDMGNWEVAMFRFVHINTIRIIYNRKAGAPQIAKNMFDVFLMGSSPQLFENVYGFYNYCPAVHNKRSPAVDFATTSKLLYSLNHGISEDHTAGDDKWLDMWKTVDGSNN